jgi:hypothetical protein
MVSIVSVCIWKHSLHTVYLFNLFPIFRCSHQPGLHRRGCRVRRSHHRVKQVLEHGGWVRATAGVHRRYLYYGAARCNEPVEALLCESWPIGPACSPPAQMVGMAARWSRTVAISSVASERQQPLLIQLNACFEEAFGRARDDHTDVSTNSSRSTLGMRAYYSVIIRIVIAHGSPPPGKTCGAEPAQQVTM